MTRSKLGELLFYLGTLFLQVELNRHGEAEGKQFFMARDYHPIEPDSTLHDLRLLPNGVTCTLSPREAEAGRLRV